MRPVHNCATKLALTSHQVNHKKNSRRDKEVKPRDITTGVLLSRRPPDLRRAQQRAPIRVYQVNFRLLPIRVPEHNRRRPKQPKHPQVRISLKENHFLPQGQLDARHRSRPTVPNDAAIASLELQQALSILLERSQHSRRPKWQKHPQLHDHQNDENH